MNDERRAAIRRRLGPVGMSLAAAALTAIGFAAVSIADSGGNDTKEGDSGAMWAAPPPGGGVGVMHLRGLSEADQQKLEDFRQCMEDNGAPAPPDPGEIDPSEGPPKLPSEADREKIQKADEACKDELPDDLQHRDGLPHIGGRAASTRQASSRTRTRAKRGAQRTAATRPPAPPLSPGSRGAFSA
jgi:hypothetical protein